MCQQGNELTDREFLQRVGRHCVAVGWEDAPPGELNATGGFAFSAFIMSVRGLWFLVTAGHVLDDINTRLGQNRQFRYATIVDAWSDRGRYQHPIPFPDIVDQNRTPQGHMYQEATGVDYGWFYLRDYYRDLLGQNGIASLSEGAWRDVPDDLASFNAFGFPDEVNFEDRDQEGRYRGLRIRPRLVPYTRVIDPPPDFQLQFPRLFFRPPVLADEQIADVRGLSGGPVFGYRQIPGGLHYWLVGVQSTQLDQSRLAIVCPAEPFARSFERAMEDVIAARGLEHA